MIWCLIQEPGVIEAEFARIGTARVLKEFLTYRNPGPLYLPKDNGFGHPTDSPIELPSWLSEEECNYYAAKYEKTGFTGGLNYYRNLDLCVNLQPLPYFIYLFIIIIIIILVVLVLLPNKYKAIYTHL